MHTRDVVKGKTIKINSVGRTEKHKYDVRVHLRRLQAIFEAQQNEFVGVKLQQTVVVVFFNGINKYIGTNCTVQKKSL